LDLNHSGSPFKHPSPPWLPIEFMLFSPKLMLFFMFLQMEKQLTISLFMETSLLLQPTTLNIFHKKKWSSREIKSYTIFFRSAIEIYHWNFDNNTTFFNWKYSPLTIWLNLYIKAVGGREFGCIQLWTTCPCKILF